MKTYYVYILGSKSGTLYTGVTSNLFRRVNEHKKHIFAGFTREYNVNQLLYYEKYGTPEEAIKREKQIKSWRREKKIKLIDIKNPSWNDLAESWYDSYIRVDK
jgi:putative endonuclease